MEKFDFFTSLLSTDKAEIDITVLTAFWTS